MTDIVDQGSGANLATVPVSPTGPSGPTGMKNASWAKWWLALGAGTILPIWLSLQSLKYLKTDFPADCWEFIAVGFTGLAFLFVHGAKLVERATGLRSQPTVFLLVGMGFVCAIWILLCLPFAGHILSIEHRLIGRWICGWLMLGILFLVDGLIWQWSPVSTDPRVKYKTTLLMLDLPTFASLIGVSVFCYAILYLLPNEKLGSMFSGIDGKSLETTRLSIASTFYSGAAAFHLMLGNAVFSFIHSGCLFQTVGNHPCSERTGTPEGATAR